MNLQKTQRVIFAILILVGMIFLCQDNATADPMIKAGTTQTQIGPSPLNNLGRKGDTLYTWKSGNPAAAGMGPTIEVERARMQTKTWEKRKREVAPGWTMERAVADAIFSAGGEQQYAKNIQKVLDRGLIESGGAAYFVYTRPQYFHDIGVYQEGKGEGKSLTSQSLLNP